MTPFPRPLNPLPSTFNFQLSTFLLLLALSLPSMVAQGLFREVASEVGLNFFHYAGEKGNFYLHEIMGPGAALFDYDGDGDLDVYLLQGTEHGSSQEGDPAPWVHRLFRNDLVKGEDGGGVLAFTDVTKSSRTGHRGYGMGAAAGDYDGDGDLDLYVTHFGPNVLYRNNGDGTFSDVTQPSRTGDSRWSTSAAFLDYDRDGDLDLFVLNYIDFTTAGNKQCYSSTGAPDFCNPNIYRPLPDRLFQNLGDGRFRDVTEAAGMGTVIGPGLGVTCADFNLDGWIDLYVANDGAANFLWLNRQDGTFQEGALLAGAAFNDEGTAEGSMGIAARDFDNDGDADLFMTHLSMETNTFYENDGKAFFRDETIPLGLGASSFSYTGFGTGGFDYDNDGRLDLFIANGAVRLLGALRGDPYPYHQRNQLFRNEGKRFREISGQAGEALQLSEVSRSAVFGDVDNDGDVDVLVTNNRGPVRLLLNQTSTGNHWLQVALEGAGKNRFGVHARVQVQLADGSLLWRHVGSSGSYLGASDLRIHYGLGVAPKVESIIVEWPDGSSEKWTGIGVDDLVRLRKGAGQARD